MAAGKRGKPRPDVRERVEAMHADKKQHRQWHLALLEGRAAGRRTIAKRTDAIDPLMIRNAKNRLNGLKENAHRPANAQRDWYQVAVAKVLELHTANQRLGVPTLAKRASASLGIEVTTHLVRQALGRI